jgi:peroxiredoxin
LGGNDATQESSASLTAPGNKPVKLADLLGKGPVVIYTFIQAFTSV